jgi:hypothetical protein
MSVILDDNFVCISALIDNSGSMANLDTTELAQSLTKMIREQCDMDKEVIFYGATFSDNFNIFADGVNGNTVNITKQDILPNGMTSLIPAFARMIKTTGKRLSDMVRRPGKVIFILLSDGEQTCNQLSNSSRSPDDINYEGNDASINLKKLIEEHSNVYNWDFIYLGTNYDSIKAGQQFGLKPTQCLNYAYTPKGSQNATRVCSQAMSRMQKSNFVGFEEEERTLAMDGQ